MPAKPALGLYFTDDFIEVSQISKDGTKLEKYSQAVLPPGAVTNGVIKNHNVFAQSLQQLFLSAKPKPIKFNEEVVVGVSDSRVFLRVFDVPNLPGKNINDAIEYQARSILQVMPGGVESDWQIIGKGEEGQIEVLLAAIPRDIIDSVVEACTLFGLRVVAVEPAVFANIRVINQTQFAGKNQLLVYIGNNFGAFSYLTGGNPRFSEMLTNAEIYQNGGFQKTIQTYINFANNKNSKRIIQEIIVTGSRPDLEAVAESLKTSNVFATKAFGRILTSNTQFPFLLETSHGLGLKSIDTQPSLNILPLEFKLEVISQRLNNVWQAFLIFLIIITATGFLRFYYVYKTTTEQLARNNLIKNELTQQLALPENLDLMSKAEDLNRLTSRLMTLRTITGGEEMMLNRLSEVTPQGLNLNSFVITRNPASKSLTEKSSWILSGNASSRVLVLNFYNDLIKMPEFLDGKLYFGSLEKNTGLTFRIASKQQNEK